MKRQSLPVKRRPAPQSIFKRLSAVTGRRRRQSVAAAAAAHPDDYPDDGSSRISRNLTVIFLVHVVAIGLWFTHEHFFAVADAETTSEASADQAAAAPAPAPGPRLPSGAPRYVVRYGDNYATIAAAHGITEAELREANGHRRIESGVFLTIPPRLIRATPPPELNVGNPPATPSPTAPPAAPPTTPPATPAVDSGLVDAVPVDSTPPPRAQPVQPDGSRSAASGKSYVVQPGDTIWRISTKFNVSQDALMRANKITDPKRMRIGMTLVIP